MKIKTTKEFREMYLKHADAAIVDEQTGEIELWRALHAAHRMAYFELGHNHDLTWFLGAITDEIGKQGQK